jgi:hypothetical protein
MLEFGIIIAVLIGLGQVAKQLGLPNKYIPVMNLVLGVTIGLIGGLGSDLSIVEQIVTGSVIGLTASGLYDQKKIVSPK